MHVSSITDISDAAVPSDKTAHAAPTLGDDTAELASAENLTYALSQTPEVRSEKVTEAAALVSDVSYPPLVLIEKLSVLFAAQLLADISHSQTAPQPVFND